MSCVFDLRKSGIPPHDIAAIVLYITFLLPLVGVSLYRLYRMWRSNQFPFRRARRSSTAYSYSRGVRPPNTQPLRTVENVAHGHRLHPRSTSARPVSRLPPLPGTSSEGSGPIVITIPTSSLYNSPLDSWKEKSDESLNECPICLEDINPADAVDGAPCGHRLCPACRERMVESARLRGETARCHACRVAYEN